MFRTKGSIDSSYYNLRFLMTLAVKPNCIVNWFKGICKQASDINSIRIEPLLTESLNQSNLIFFFL
jgi:hypothetical protein